MPSWNEVFREVTESARINNGRPDLDGIRQKYIAALRSVSKRAVIVYGSAWMAKPGLNNLALSVEANDVHGMMSACHQVPDKELDLVIHSPGGSMEAAEQVMNYLRTQFDYIRAIVPMQAKSAANDGARLR